MTLKPGSFVWIVTYQSNSSSDGHVARCLRFLLGGSCSLLLPVAAAPQSIPSWVRRPDRRRSGCWTTGHRLFFSTTSRTRSRLNQTDARQAMAESTGDRRLTWRREGFGRYISPKPMQPLVTSPNLSSVSDPRPSPTAPGSPFRLRRRLGLHPAAEGEATVEVEGAGPFCRARAEVAYPVSAESVSIRSRARRYSSGPPRT